MGPFTAVGERRSLVTDLSKEKGPKSTLSLSCLQSEVVFHDSSSIVLFLNRRDPDVGFPSAKELSRSVKFFSTLSYLPTISLRGKQRQGRSNRFHIQAARLAAQSSSIPSPSPTAHVLLATPCKTKRDVSLPFHLLEISFVWVSFFIKYSLLPQHVCEFPAPL